MRTPARSTTALLTLALAAGLAGSAGIAGAIRRS